MPKSNINILDGLSFGERNAQHERMMNVSFNARIGALASRREHGPRVNITGVPQTILWHNAHNSTYTYTREGQLYKDAGLVLGGFSGPATLVEAKPNSETTETWLFVASSQMRKYSGTNIYEWGISQPFFPLDVSLGTGDSTQLHSCDNVTNWAVVDGGATIATDTGIKQEGSGSLRLNLSTPGADTLVSLTLTFAAPVNFAGTDRTVIAFWLRMDNPKAITRFSMLFALANDNFNSSVASRELMAEYAPVYPGTVPEQQEATVPQTESSESNTELVDVSQRRLTQIPSIPNVWKRVSLTRDTFALSPVNANWTNVYRMRITLASSIAQNVYFDDFSILAENQDDALGARYKYAYESSLTRHRGNLNTHPSIAIKGEHNAVNVGGFTEPPAGQGIDTIRIFRDVGGNGVYQSVGALAVPVPWNPGLTFVDTVGVRELGEVDTNDNTPPQPATLVVRHLGSFWLNDVSNPRRIWRTPPGRFESVSLQSNSGFFDIGEVGDRIVAFGIVAGQFFIWTLRAIYQVGNPQGTPIFRKMVDVGTVNQYSICVVNELAVFAWWDGIYTFDGANLRLLPKIGALFDSNSLDFRRVIEATIQDIVLGSDGKYLWVTFRNSQTNDLQTFLYDHVTKQWVEDSAQITAHEPTNLLFFHIFGTANGAILNAFSHNILYAGFDYESADIELANIGFILSIGLDISDQQLDATLSVFVDQALVYENTFSRVVDVDRRWEFFALSDNVIGQYVRIKIVSQSTLVLHNAYIEHRVISDTNFLDSGPISIGGRITQTGISPAMTRASSLNVDTKLLGLAQGEVRVTLEMDNSVVDVGVLNTTKGQIAVLQQTVEHITGSVLRVRARGVRFAPISITAGLSLMGSREAEYVAIPLNT